MNTIKQSALATWAFILNKAFAFIVLGLLMLAYTSIPQASFDPDTGMVTGGMPFAEVLYGVMMIVGVIVVAPMIRLLFFPEAAYYAESGQLQGDLKEDTKSLKYEHYRMATIISFAVTLLIFAAMQ